MSQVGGRVLSASGWSVLQGPYQIDLENVESNGQEWHTIDWSNRVPRKSTFEGGLARKEVGHMERLPFLKIAEDVLDALRRKDAPPTPPTGL